jgi:hypothetical protein
VFLLVVAESTNAPCHSEDYFFHLALLIHGLPLDSKPFLCCFQNRAWGNKPFYSAKVVNGATVVPPDLQDLRGYFDKTVWVRVPLNADHSYRYYPSAFWTAAVLHAPLTTEEVGNYPVWRGWLSSTSRLGLTSSLVSSMITSGSVMRLLYAGRQFFPWSACPIS